MFPTAYGQLSDKTGYKQNFVVTTGGYDFPVEVVASFDIDRLDFDSDEKRLTIHLNSGIENNLAEILLPKNLIGGNFTFFLNDQEIFPKVAHNDKISFITVEFEGKGISKLDIIGTTYLPEFSYVTPLILLLLLIPVVFVSKIKKFSFSK